MKAKELIGCGTIYDVFKEVLKPNSWEVENQIVTANGGHYLFKKGKSVLEVWTQYNFIEKIDPLDEEIGDEEGQN